MKHFSTSTQSVLLFLAAAGTALVSGAAGAQAVPSPMNLSRSPLFLNAAVDPNVAVTLDDSGSMRFAYMPDPVRRDEVSGRLCAYRTPRFYSSSWNFAYFNPNVRYTPPLLADGTPLPNSPFNAAFRDGFLAHRGLDTVTIDLATAYEPAIERRANNVEFDVQRVRHDPNAPLVPDATCPEINTSSSISAQTTYTWQLPFATGGTGTPPAAIVSPAFYYQFTGTDIGNAAQRTDSANFQAVNVATASADVQQNFANWYSYYRSRLLLARTSLSRVFGTQDAGLRVALQHLNSRQFSAAATEWQRFSGAPRTTFFSNLYDAPASGGTPNFTAMERAGNIFASGAAVTNARNPYWEGAPLSRELSCRQNFHVHVTDGFTNQGNEAIAYAPRPTIGGVLPDGESLVTSDPESRIFWDVAPVGTAPCNGDGRRCDPSLADIAYAYWATDLRPGLANNVPPYFEDRSTGVTGPVVSPLPENLADNKEIYWNPVNNPATWQHMVNYTVGLGVAGGLRWPADYTALRTGALQWPGSYRNDLRSVDDLWHAGLVSRGGYFSAANPQELVDSLSAALTSVVARRGSVAAATVTSGVLQASALAFRTGFDSGDWSGRVFANTLDEQGFVVEPPEWEAGELLDLRSPDDRVILTSEDATGDGIPFRWGNLPSDYQDALNDDPATNVVDSDGLGERRVLYIRGDRSLEINNGGPFRIRSGLLGAVINSGAVVVAAPAQGYSDENFPGGPEESATEKYSDFKRTYKDRRRTIYVGSNDGMLHAFDAGSGVTGFDADGDPVVDLGTGEELWAYVPREVAPNLSRLTNPNFEFTPYVDATPAIRDVFINGRWRTLLVGSLRRGGQGIFALDVTDPNITEGDADSVVLWEFSDDVPGASRMGFSYGRPNIARLSNGRWVVVVSGGYNSEQLTASEPQVAPIDASAQKGGSTLFVLDAETGDELRRFEFTPAQSRGLGPPTMGDYETDYIDDFAVAGDLQGNIWRFDFLDPDPGNWSVERVYRPATEFVQPITSAPRLFPDAKTGGLIVVVGTGKYLEPGDRSVVGVPTQALLGVRDYGQGSPNYPIQPTQLQVQTLTKAPATPPAKATFTITNNVVLDTQRGWRIPLVDAGERAVTTAGALFSQGISIFSTIIPNGDDPCLPGLRGNLFVLDAATGGAPRIDSNGDGIIDAGDLGGRVGTEVDDPPQSGSPSGAEPPGGGQIRLTDFPEIVVPTSIWRRRGWREISAED